MLPQEFPIIALDAETPESRMIFSDVERQILDLIVVAREIGFTFDKIQVIAREACDAAAVDTGNDEALNEVLRLTQERNLLGMRALRLIRVTANQLGVSDTELEILFDYVYSTSQF